MRAMELQEEDLDMTREKLGEGNFGEVYKVFHKRFERAVKILREGGGRNTALRREMFEREIRMLFLANKRKDNKATVFEGYVKSKMWIVMDTYEKTLEEVVIYAFV